MTGRRSGGTRSGGFVIRAELDAAYFHLYGLERDDVEHVMDSFDALKRRGEAADFGEFRTKELILERLRRDGRGHPDRRAYQTILDPPPGHGPRHPERDVLRERRPWLTDRYGTPCIVWEALQILRDAPGRCSRVRSRLRLASAVQPTPYEDERHRSGGSRWETALRFHSGDAATVGWMTKRGGWAITEAGIEALDAYPTPDELFAELNRRYREIDQRRKQAQQNLGDVQQFIATTLRLVEAGTWTAHEDLADLAGTTAAEVAHFLASGQVRAAQRLPGAQRRRQHSG